MSDGLSGGPLYELQARPDLGADLDLCAKVMSAHTRGSIAAMSRLVARAAHDGDSSAIRIFDEAARELAAIVEAVRQALEFEPGETVPVSHSGGVFNSGALILDPFRRDLEQRSGSYRVTAPILTPSGGAAIYAARLAAQPLSVQAMQRLASSLHLRDR